MRGTSLMDTPHLDIVDKAARAASGPAFADFQCARQIDEGQRRQLVIEWNKTGSAFPAHVCVHELFAEQASLTPDVLAIVKGSDYLTYRELDRRANQLGHYLRSLGVGPEVIVGLRAERSLEMIIGLLGILK